MPELTATTRNAVATAENAHPPTALFWQNKLPSGSAVFQLPVDAGTPLTISESPTFEWGTVGQIVAPRDHPLTFGPFPGEGPDECRQRLELEAEYENLLRMKEHCNDHHSEASDSMPTSVAVLPPQLQSNIITNEDQRLSLRHWCHYRPYLRFFTEVLYCDICRVEISDFAFKISLDRDGMGLPPSESLLDHIIKSIHKECEFNFRFRYDKQSNTITIAHHQFSKRTWSEQAIYDILSKTLTHTFQVRVKKVPPLLHIAFPNRESLDSVRAALMTNVYLCDHDYYVWYGTTAANGEAMARFCEALSGNQREQRANCDSLRRHGLPRRPISLERRLKPSEHANLTNRVSDMLLKQLHHHQEDGNDVYHRSHHTTAPQQPFIHGSPVHHPSHRSPVSPDSAQHQAYPVATPQLRSRPNPLWRPSTGTHSVPFNVATHHHQHIPAFSQQHEMCCCCNMNRTHHHHCVDYVPEYAANTAASFYPPHAATRHGAFFGGGAIRSFAPHPAYYPSTMPSPSSLSTSSNASSVHNACSRNASFGNEFCSFGGERAAYCSNNNGY